MADVAFLPVLHARRHKPLLFSFKNFERMFSKETLNGSLVTGDIQIFEKYMDPVVLAVLASERDKEFEMEHGNV